MLHTALRDMRHVRFSRLPRVEVVTFPAPLVTVTPGRLEFPYTLNSARGQPRSVRPACLFEDHDFDTSCVHREERP
jgi:hypothetical protein